MDVRRVSLFKLVEESAIEALFAAEDDYIYFSRSRSRCVMRSVPESTLRRDFVNRTFLLGTIRTFSFGGDTQDLSLDTFPSVVYNLRNFFIQPTSVFASAVVP